ncbi:MAG: hypothetical protein QM535_10390 [Limnohabitans sp.]|nr:hypothetical protein [Limnohabitans sp.]
MLGLLLLYFVWKRFADLAKRFKKSRRKNGWLGILAYFGGGFTFVILISLLDVLLELNINWDNNTALNFIAIPFGIGGCYILYIFLEKKWNKEVQTTETIDNIGQSDIEA